MNKFQKFLNSPENINVSNEIVQLFHPETTFNIKVSYLYDWVVITGKGISIGIAFVVPLFGEGRTMSEFVNIYNTSYFRAWRFVDDSKYIKGQLKQESPDINQILANYNTPRPTPTQMYNYYYKD